MNFNDLLIQERELCIKALCEILADQRKIDPRAASEVLIELNSDKFSGVYRLMRPDILYKSVSGQPQVIEVNKQTYLSFDPFVMTVDDIPVRISPFHWNGVEFHVAGRVKSWAAFEDWADYWIDSKDARYEEGKDWLNVIHSVTPPECENERWNFSVDFGSAEVSCINELLEILIQIGAREIEVGSFSMIDEYAD